MLFSRALHFVFLILPLATKATEHVIDDARFQRRDQGGWTIPPPESREIGTEDKKEVSGQAHTTRSDVELYRRADVLPPPPSDWKNFGDWVGVILATVTAASCTGIVILGAGRAMIRLTRRQVPTFAHCFAEVWATARRLAGNNPAPSDVNMVERGLVTTLLGHLDLLEAGSHTAEQVMEMVVETLNGHRPHSDKREALPFNGETGFEKLSISAREAEKPEFVVETRLVDASSLVDPSGM